MDRLYFVPHAHHAHVGDEITVLDEIADRYILLDKKQTASLITYMRHGSPCAVGEKLKKAGILSEEEGTPVSPSGKRPDGVGLLRWGSSSSELKSNLSLTMLCRAALALIRVRRDLRVRGLHFILASMRKQASGISLRINESDYVTVAQRCGKHIKIISPYLPFKIKCLEFSLALQQMLRQRSIKSTFIIGYQRYDFLSHAWIEINGTVIMDEANLSSRLTPILRIE